MFSIQMDQCMYCHSSTCKDLKNINFGQKSEFFTEGMRTFNF